MRRVVLILALLTSLLVPAVSIYGQAQAYDTFGNFCHQQNAPQTDICQSNKTANGNPIVHTLKAAIEVISYITGALAIVFILLAALRFITAAGSPEGVAGARTALAYALVGVVVAALSQAIVIFVMGYA